jgi:hypothetical protein
LGRRCRTGWPRKWKKSRSEARRRDPVDVVVAEDGDRFLLLDGFLDARHSALHVRKLEGIVQIGESRGRGNERASAASPTPRAAESSDASTGDLRISAARASSLARSRSATLHRFLTTRRVYRGGAPAGQLRSVVRVRPRRTGALSLQRFLDVLAHVFGIQIALLAEEVSRSGHVALSGGTDCTR